MAIKTRPKKKFLEIFDEPSKKGFAIFTGICTIFGIGFQAGDFKKDLDLKLELIKAQQECNRLIETEKSNCEALRQKYEGQKIEELINVVNELKKARGGKNEK